MYRLPLFDHRVLDLTDGLAGYAGRVLCDLGAEVIKVEPPTGDTLRGSPLFDVVNANKYSCTVAPSDEATLLRLSELSVILIAPTGGVDVEALRVANDSLIILLLPPNAGVIEGTAAAGAVGLALWDQRRTGKGGVIEIGSVSGPAIAAADQPSTEPVSTLSCVVDVPSSPLRMSETPPHIRLPAPALGEHNAYVFEHLLGMTIPTGAP